MEDNKQTLALAFSGGGFRASLFHIGVLSYLAENGILKDVEVISCVSGGSIIGAFYYLYLKKLYEEKRDDEILQDDYISLVTQLENDFMEGIQKNIRVREYSNMIKNILMIKENYSNSDRMAELYEKMFYSRFAKEGILKMRDLVIKPLGADGFDIRTGNAGRKNKIPMIILNSSTLNTGRNFQFTPVDFGERMPKSVSLNFDKNCLLKAFKYEELDETKFKKYKDLPLCVAVAASASVPGIFTPLSLTKLYPNTVPLLVDGGVYDNQGLSAILYENCSDIIVSDASNQMEFKRSMGSDFFNVLSRTSSNQMNRIRNLGLESLILNKKANIVDDIEIIHLLEDTNINILAPGEDDFDQTADSEITPFGVNKEVHDVLSKVRTDLDCFTDVESYSLMYEAYKISHHLMEKSDIKNKYKSQRKDTVWNFLKIEDYATGKKASNDYMKQLKISTKVMFKSILIEPLLALPTLFIFIVSLLPLCLMYFTFTQFYEPLLFLKLILYSIGIFFIPWITNTIFRKRVILLNWLKLPLALIMSPSVSISASLYLLLINPFYIKRGKIDYLKRKDNI